MQSQGYRLGEGAAEIDSACRRSGRARLRDGGARVSMVRGLRADRAAAGPRHAVSRQPVGRVLVRVR